MSDSNSSQTVNKIGIMGVLINGILVAIKLGVGFVTSSIAITSDGFNNLSDFLNVLITFIALKFSMKPADDDHPFGHERFEIIAGFSVAMIIFYLGIETIRTSIGALLTGEITTHSSLFLQVSIVSLVLKAILMMVYRKYAKLMKSPLLMTNAWDSFFDMLISISLIAVFFLQPYFTYNLDAIMGILIGLLLFYTSIILLREFISGLLGKKADPQEINSILKILDDNQDIAGYHDLSIHSYGKFHNYALVHVEVDETMALLDAHAIIDSIEAKILSETGIKLDVHLDPLDLRSPEIKKVIYVLKYTLGSLHPMIDFHDVHILDTVLNFDIFNPTESKITDERILEVISKQFPEYELNIAFEHINLINEFKIHEKGKEGKEL